ncbi:MAG: biotin transporter BioY [Firmicutes bacterium]|jgi:biotin transport system substrate-specific component|nr:biotin transporter BioY [Bacillota bacterium]
MKTFKLQDLTRIAMFTALMCVFAYVFLQLPISPAPISAQTFGVMLTGLILKPKSAALSQGLYLLLGSLGLPVFSGGTSGIGILVGPRGGYLWGFVIGAYVTAAIIQKAEENNKPISWTILALASLVGGIILVYITGVLQLAIISDLPLITALEIGTLPFIPGDLAKAAIASLIAKRLREVLF